MQEALRGRAPDRPDLDVEARIALLPRDLIRERMAGLRHQTAPAHERLDGQISASGWLRTIDGYRELLTRFYGYYRPLDAVLRDAVIRFDLPLDVEARRKSDLIAHDLLALGLTPDRLEGIPKAHTLPEIGSREAALGSLYVVEGATLGGQVIARHLRRGLGGAVEGGLAFFSSYGTDVGRRWHTFCSLLSDALPAPDAERTISAAADAMFSGFGRWLGEGGTAR